MPNHLKPYEIKELEGTVRKDRVRPHVKGKVVTQCPPLPPDTTLGPIATQIWWETLTRLTALRVVTENDLRALAAYCAASENWELCQRDIRENGLVIQVHTTSGMVPRRNPAVDIASMQFQIMKEMMGRFGLTPSDRQRVAPVDQPQEQEDEWQLDD